jgi:hypothetical protein
MLVISSAGGDIEAGMRFGRLVRDWNLNVYVEELCASSCANYVFPAAKRKIIGYGALVGWHGGAVSKSFAGMDIAHLDVNSPMLKYLEKLRAEEVAFFHSIGVRQELVCAGDEVSGQTDQMVGWTMPISAMRRFGITDVFAVAHETIPTTVRRRQNSQVIVLDPFPRCTGDQERAISSASY